MEKKNLQINIAYINKDFKISKKPLSDIFSYILKKEKFKKKPVIDIAFTGNKEIQKLNSLYRGKNKPTDVLSFLMDDDDENKRLKGGHMGPPLLGEIIISVPYARAQAKEKKHAIKKEIIFLLIHGLLHLLGYDDETVKGYDAMMKKQNEYLKQIKSN